MDETATTPAHDALIERLVRDARPVQPLWPPWRRLLVWIPLGSVPLGVACVTSLRPDLADVSDSLLVELLLLLGNALVAAALALCAAVPGSRIPMPARIAAAVSVGAALLAMGAASAAGTRLAAPAGTQCALCVLAFGALPWLALGVAVRRGAPVEPSWAGAWVGAAGFLCGAAATRLACSVDERAHLLAWHVPPVVLGVLVSALLGIAVARRVLATTRADRLAAG